MARAATTSDAFNAVAEPRRRDILDALAGGERGVNDLVEVLRETGLVEVRSEGRRRLYRLNGRPLKPIHDWVKDFERTWTERFEAMDVVLEELKGKEQGDDGDDE
jgi:DNA-binding transcriptional ArsR family regulator